MFHGPPRGAWWREGHLNNHPASQTQPQVRKWITAMPCQIILLRSWSKLKCWTIQKWLSLFVCSSARFSLSCHHLKVFKKLCFGVWKTQASSGRNTRVKDVGFFFFRFSWLKVNILYAKAASLCQCWNDMAENNKGRKRSPDSEQSSPPTVSPFIDWALTKSGWLPVDQPPAADDWTHYYYINLPVIIFTWSPYIINSSYPSSSTLYIDTIPGT